MRKALVVLMLIGLLSVSAASVGARPPAPAPTIVDIVLTVSGNSGYDDNGDDFDVLREAVIALGLADVLSQRGQYTVFAPNDSAFEALAGVTEEQVVSTLVGAFGADAVRDIVLYHVAPGRRYAQDVVSSNRIRTLNRAFIMVDGTVLNGTINIIATDIEASNGVVHVIDSVLLP